MARAFGVQAVPVLAVPGGPDGAQVLREMADILAYVQENAAAGAV